MTTAKLIDNNRRSHAAKVLAKASKKNQSHEHDSVNAEAEGSETVESTDSSTTAREEILGTLNEHYTVIREDILKLREDLAKGYDVVKELIDTKLNIKTLLPLLRSK